MAATGFLVVFLGLACVAVVALIAVGVIVLAVSRRSNPDVVPCPGCGRMVGRFAENCPHCGRPLLGAPDA